MHPVYLLAFATFAILVAFLIWNKISINRRQQTGGHTSGLGGPNDPMAGVNPEMRNPEQMRQSLDAAEQGADAPPRPVQAR